MEINRMLQLALGVPDSVPQDRRDRMLAWKLAETALNEDELGEVDIDDQQSDAQFVLQAIVKAYENGDLDARLADIKAPHLRLAGMPAAVVHDHIPHAAWGSSHERLEALAKVGIDRLAEWAQANLRLDDL